MELYHLIPTKTGQYRGRSNPPSLGRGGGVTPQQFAVLRFARRSSACRLLWYSAAWHADSLRRHKSARYFGSGALENVTLVETYRMSDTEYEQRQGTLRSWVKDQQQADPLFTLQKHAQEHHDLQLAVRRYKMGLELPEGFKVQGGQLRVEPSRA
jgi:hypothetical protein